MIEADVEQLGALFHADGEGLPEDVITTVLAPVEELLTVLQLDTSILIANFKQVHPAVVITLQALVLSSRPN